ncbi:MAG: bifunctional enzyme conserved domain protein [Frankiales bacterium]|nr:bifunctional enzyme conserved domain protein [Frankiales bacterium]
MPASETVEVSGHLMDSGVLALVLDDVLGYGGDYRIDRLDVGRAHDDESYARIVVSAEDAESLQRLLMRLQAHGVNQVDPGQAMLKACDRDGVFPDDFYSTTNLETVVRLDGEWVPVEQPEMDCGLVVEGRRVHTVPVSDVKAGQQVVCGASGVKVVLPAREHSANDAFEFMSSAVSSEKPQALLVRQIAQRMREVKSDGGKILWVGGPAIVHTGAAPAMVALVEHDFVDILFAGNALATHDIESALYGTSLGVDLAQGKGVEHGHEHHIRAINTIRRSGSIAAAVADGTLTGGVMHAMVRHSKEFVLVGSVRDDGPLPDVYTDVIEGQRAMRAHLPGVGFAIMVATMLHSIATGNILPASVPLVSVDINPATVTKLADRGSSQALGIVTDIGLFLEQLARELVPGYTSA